MTSTFNNLTGAGPTGAVWIGVFSDFRLPWLTQQKDAMKNSLFKTPSPNTHPIGDGKTIQTFAVTDQAAAMFPDVAAELGFPNVSEYIRYSCALCAEILKSAQAAAFKAAIRTRDAAPRVLGIFFIFAIPTLSFTANFEARRPRRAGMAVRTQAHQVRKQEAAA